MTRGHAVHINHAEPKTSKSVTTITVSGMRQFYFTPSGQ